MINWERYAPYIAPAEVMCRCGHCSESSADEVDPGFLETVLALRLTVGESFRFSSFYRCPMHPIEAGKEKPGTHSMGLAADIVANNDLAMKITKAALNHPRIGAVRWSQKGDHGSRFVHIDAHDRGFYHIGSY